MSESPLNTNTLIFVESRYRTALVKHICFYQCDTSTRRRCTKEGCQVPVCSEHSDERQICFNCNQTDVNTTFSSAPSSSPKQGRCRICPSKGKVSRTVCDSCERHVCADHHKKIIWCVCHKTEEIQNRLLSCSSNSEPEAPKTKLAKKALIKNQVIQDKFSLATSNSSATAINRNHETPQKPVEDNNATMKCFKCRTSTRRICGDEKCGAPVCGKCSKKYIVCGKYPPKSNSCYPGSTPVTSLKHRRCALCDHRGKISQTTCNICGRFLCLPHRITKVQCLNHAPPEVFKLRRRRRININRTESETDNKKEAEATIKRTIIKFNFRRKFAESVLVSE